MKEVQVKSLGLVYPVKVPETVEEFDTLAGKVGACLESAIANEIYRGTNAEFRSAFIDALPEATGIQRNAIATGETEEIEDEDGNKSTVEVTKLEDEGKYFDRVCAELGIDKSDSAAKQARFQDIIDKLYADEKTSWSFDPSPAKRKSGARKPAKLTKSALETAAYVISLGEENLQTVVANLKKNGFEVVVDPEKGITQQNLATAIWMHERAKATAAKRAQELLMG